VWGDAQHQCRPILPPCPVPLYYFPKPYPYSKYPVVASSLPRSLRPSNPNLRVRIPNPWAQSLQFFESDPTAQTKPPETPHTPEVPSTARKGPTSARSYACYTVYTRPGQRYVTPLAPPRSTFDFAWEMFRKFFKKRVGVDWDSRESLQMNGDGPGREEGNLGGEDGPADGLFEFFGPAVAKQHSESENPLDSIEARQRKPSVTVLMNTNTDRAMSDRRLDIQAKTPEGGW